MAIKVGGTVVVDDGRAISNVTNVSATDATFSGTGAVKVPTGTTAEQPSSPSTGMIRFNLERSLMEVYDGTVWKSIGPSDAKQYFLANY